jgi:hypothetical protein
MDLPESSNLEALATRLNELTALCERVSLENPKGRLTLYDPPIR